MPDTLPEIVVIGGSAGSFPVVLHIIEALPLSFPFALVLILHRQKSGPSEMDKVLSLSTHVPVIEPNDKEFVLPSRVYLAPQNYHLLIEKDRTFSLDYSEAVHYSRPAIDPAFESAGDTFGNRAVGILLSGSNHDGAAGLAHLVALGGKALVQDPSLCDFPAMPLAGLARVPEAEIVQPSSIVNRLFSL